MEQDSGPSGGVQGGSRVSSAPARQPARVTLTGHSGNQMHVNIGKITGSVTVGNKNTVVHHHGERRHLQHSESDSSDTSSSDSETESFFASKGVKMPSKRQFREMPRNMKQMAMKSNPPANFVHSVFVKNSTTTAFDSRGNPVKLQSPNINLGRRPESQVNSAAQNNPPALMNPASNQRRENRQLQTPDQPTTYEQQTHTFERVVRDFQIPPDRIIDERMIQKISRHFGKGWRRLFRHLNISDIEIDQVFLDCGQMQETVYNLLLQWKRSTNTPDMRTLVEALVRAQQMSIIQHLLN